MTKINEKTMQDQYQKAHAAIKNEAKEQIAVALHTVIISLGAEKLAVSDRLADLTGNELFSSHGRALVNREQELYIAQKVLCELAVKEYRGRGRQQQCVSATTAVAMPAAVAVHAMQWRTIKDGMPAWTDDNSIRVIAITAEDDFGGAQVHDVVAADFHICDPEGSTDHDSVGTEVTRACTHWAYRDEIWPRDMLAATTAAAEPVRDMAVGLDRARYYAQAVAQQIGYDEVVESIRERDEAEEFGDKLLDLVLGNDRPEWSSAYGTDDALLQVEEKMVAISKQLAATSASPNVERLKDLRERLTPAARDVLSERARQINIERWTPEHDDEHGIDEMAEAAGCYLLFSDSHRTAGDPPLLWPLASEWWKPGDRRRELVKAVALGLAEIERFDRAAIAAAKGEPAKLKKTEQQNPKTKE